MRHTPPTDTSPRTARQHPGVSRLDGFDCQLPDDAREELLAPRRARMLGRPDRPVQRSPARPPWREYLWAIVLLAALVVFISLCSTGTYQTSTPKATPAATSAAPVLPTPAATAATPAAPSAPARPTTPVVSRAELVRLPSPPPRARLVRLPAPRMELSPEHLDESHRITMPYGTEVLATLRGFLGTEDQLPRVGHIGDMYVVGTTPWIWLVAPGAARAAWIDP